MDWAKIHQDLDSGVDAIHQAIFHVERNIKLQHIHNLAMSCLNKPGVWGKQEPEEGFDCSGFIVYLLRRAGIIKMHEDYDSATLALKFPPLRAAEPGALVFYGNNGINHVMYCLTDTICIGARGVTKSIETISQAYERGAKVDVRPITYRSDLVGFRRAFELGY